MNKANAGRLGGHATHKRYGLARCPLCNSVISSGWHEEKGRPGGQETLRRYGNEHFVKLGQQSGTARRNKALGSNSPVTP